jgi:hypothetical protein
MKATFYTLDEAQMQQTANAVKDAVIRALKKEGLLPADYQWAVDHGVVIHCRGWFGKLVDAVLFKGAEEGAGTVTVVRFIA